MFEKEAEENGFGLGCTVNPTVAWQKGAEFGYNKANEWHYVKDELPIKTDSTLCELIPVFVAVKVGYHIETYGTYWNLKSGKFECLDDVYAWCYPSEPPELPPELKESEQK